MRAAGRKTSDRKVRENDVNSFHFCIDIHSSGAMKEGIVPFLPDRPCAERDDDELPVQGAEAAGVKPR